MLAITYIITFVTTHITHTRKSWRYLLMALTIITLGLSSLALSGTSATAIHGDTQPALPGNPGPQQSLATSAQAPPSMPVSAPASAPALAPATGRCTTSSFGAATNFGVGTQPYSVAVGDFNGDGKQDLVAANNGSANVSILLGTGAGSFRAATNFGVDIGPFSVAVGDFNGDGKLDLAVANGGSNNVSILLGTGSGSFGAATNFGVGTFPTSVAVGDFNGDGRQELATASFTSNNVSVLLENCQPPETFVGHVTWQGRSAQPNALQIMPLTLTLKLGNFELNYPPYLVTDASGFFTLTVTGLPSGVYNWRVKGPSYLASSGSVTLNNAVTNLEMGQQLSADITGDNVVNAVDFTQLKGNFGLGGAPPIRPDTEEGKPGKAGK